MENIWGYIATAFVSLFVGLILQRLKDRPKLLFWVPGSFIFHLKEPEIILRTDSLTIQNIGRKPATNVEIIHKERHDHFQFAIPIDFIEVTTPTGEHVVKIPSLGSQEYVNIQFLSLIKTPILLNIRSAEGKAQLIQTQLLRLWPKAVQWLAGFLMCLGAGVLLYWIIFAIMFISRAGK